MKNQEMEDDKDQFNKEIDELIASVEEISKDIKNGKVPLDIKRQLDIRCIQATDQIKALIRDLDKKE